MEAVTEFLKTLANSGVKLSADAGQLNCYVHNGSLTSDLKEGIVKYKAEILALLERRERRNTLASATTAAETSTPFPLSAGQRGLYILQKINPEMTAYNLPICLKITGDLDVQALTTAWSRVLDQHLILNARILESEGKLWHQFDDHSRTTLAEQTISITEQQQLVQFLRARAKRPFDLNRGPLNRIELFATNRQERFLLLTFHHIIFDGVSAVVLLRSLFSNYQAVLEGKSVLPSSKLSDYRRFVEWEEAMLSSAEGDSHAEYWHQRLSGELPSIELFPDPPRKAAASFEGATVVEALPAKLSRAVRDFAKAHSILPSVVFLAAFKLLLHRYTNLEDIIVGMPVMVRPGKQFSAEVGYFINMVPLRTRSSDSLTLTEFLRAVQRTMLDAIYHSEYPFELMLDQLRTRPGTKNAVFQVNYAYQNFVSDASFRSLSRLQPLDIENVREIGPEGYSDLGLEIFDKDDLFSIHFRYNPDLYREQAIRRFSTHYSTLLENISKSGDRPLHEYGFISDEEHRQLFGEFNNTRRDYPKEKCIHDFFIDQVEAQPGKTAVVFGDRALSFEALYLQSRSVAFELQSLGVKPDCVVGLCLERSLELMSAIMGTVLAGGAYLPLDPDYPDDRLSYMLEDSSAAVVLTQEKFAERLRSLAPQGVKIVQLDKDWTEIFEPAVLRGAQSHELLEKVGPQNICYVIYTSGSTGKPKGVQVEHRALVNRIHWMQKRYRLDGSDVVLQKTPYSFDVSVWEFFWPMMAGASVVFAVPDGHKDVPYLENLIKKTHVTTLHFVPSMLRAFLDAAESRCASVKRIFASGEALDRKSVDLYKTRFPNAVLHNLYGPTEAAIDVTAFDCSQLAYPFVPIGTPIDNIQLYILDPHNHPQPIGVPGELHIAGDGLARGYLNRPDLTKEKFVANPFNPGTRMYKTGDLACWLDDGNIQYLGRMDTQVKIRGFRVEVGEIEALLHQHPKVQESAVIARHREGDQQLIAFYRAKETRADCVVQLPTEELRAHLLQSVPDYMVPVSFVSVARIPLSANGKVDRRALARMDVNLVSRQPYVAPRNDKEKQLVEIWARTLGAEPTTIGIHDNFFELGGHSLRAAQLIADIRRRIGVEVPLKTFFDNASVAALVQLLGGAEKSDHRSIPSINRAEFDRLPLSYAQERLWLINQIEPNSPGYNLSGAVTVRGSLDVDQIERAFNLIIARHENLRTSFPSHEGQAYQRILDKVDFRLNRIDLSHHTDKRVLDVEARQLCRTDAMTPFDLTSGPLIRATVIKVADDEHIVMLNMHHIISDGWSIGVLINELRVIVNAFRSGQSPRLAPLSIQYVDYSVWQRRWLHDSGVLDKQLAYWKEKLAGVPQTLDLTTDLPRPNIQSFAGATRAFTLDAPLSQAVKRLAEQQSCTLYMVLLSAVKALLHRYSAQSDVCIGTAIANRQYGETDNLIGMFVNTLALRTQVAEDDTFAALMSKVKATCLEAYEHQDAPFERVVDLLRPQRNLSISPLFQVMVILQNVDMGTLGEDIQRYPVDNGISKFDLTFEFTESPESLSGSIEYSTALYRPQTIEHMIEHFTALCRSITANPYARLCDLEYLSKAEKQRLLVDLNATQAESPKNRCLHQLFVEQVPDHFSETAVVCGSEQLTYLQLYARSEDLALYLQSLGVEPDCLVGVCMDRSSDMIASVLGILQAGGAYLPLDPDYPSERLAYMLGDSRAAMVLTEEKLEDKLKAVLPSGTRLIALDRHALEIDRRVARLKAANVQLRHDVRPDNLAYVIYTSGSTGQPKGVAIEHHSPVTLVHWATGVYSQEELAGVLASTSICFDLSIYEIFVTLASGGTIILVPNALALVDSPNRELVTLINTVPSAMEELLRLRAIPKSVRTVNLAGEPLSPSLVDKIYETTKAGKVYDLYGPSEDTTYSTYALRGRQAPASIGRPIANTQIYILDSHQRPQPIGVPGELHIAGDGLARGYLHRPELTEERFVTNPFRPRARMYKTGDLARWLEDGTIQYLGRIDTQVKIRGFRVEVGEIEARLNQHPGIQDSAVVPQGQGGERQLVAFYCARDTAPNCTTVLPTEDLRAHLSKTLPEYMMPAAFVSLATIPLNPNGKVDRQTLARMDVAIVTGEKYAAPQNDTEARLVALWAETLHRGPETIGVHDNFFELGGHSLLATRLIAKIRSQLDIDLPLKALFERPTVAQIASLIVVAKKGRTPTIRAVDRKEFKRLPLSFAQERLWFINQLEPDSPAYNLPEAVTIHGELDIDQLERAFNLIISRHENLRTVFPSEAGEARQQVLDRVDFKLERIDLSHYPDSEARHTEAKRICQKDVTRFFDLTSGPLVCGKVIKLERHEHILMLNMHHIIADGWSFGILIKELGEILAAFQEDRQPELPALPIQYVDYSIWQRDRLENGGLLRQQLAYWKEKLAGVPETLNLPTDYARQNTQTVAGASEPFRLDAQLTAQIKRLGEQQGATLYMVLLAAFKALLHRYTGQTDICLGSPIANRQHAETESLIGMFVNTLALRTQVQGDDTFLELLSRVKDTCLEAYEHQDTPFEKVVDALSLRRNLASTPLFQVMVILQNVDMGTLDRHIQRFPLDKGVSKFDLTIEFRETPEGVSGLVHYRTALYGRNTIIGMVRHYVALCQTIANNPAAKVGELDYIQETEKQDLLIAGDHNQTDDVDDRCLHELFIDQVGPNASKTAVVCGNQQLTYQELFEKSQSLALYLQSIGVQPDSLVGLCMERSLNVAVAVFGILQAGGAYVPLDPDYPADRMTYMLEDSQTKIVLTEESLRNKLSVSTPDGTELVALDSQWSEIADRVAQLKARNVVCDPGVRPRHLAYVMYTSGSTGRPKGVMVEHRQIASYVKAIRNKLRLTEGLSFALVSTFAADLGNTVLFPSLLGGGILHILKRETATSADCYASYCRENRIDCMKITPSHLQALVAQSRDACVIPAKTLVLGGESLSPGVVDLVRRLNPQCRIYNHYGPTECSVGVLCGEVDRDVSGGRASLPLGSPLSGSRIYILDSRRQPVPKGVAGELYIGGVQVTRGYLNQPELTAERFVSDPFDTKAGARMYKTGDMARWLAGETVEYLGRTDFQVKIRGFRIELGEIEAQLLRHPRVKEAVVLASEDEPGEKRLVAYVTTSGAALGVEQLRSHMCAAVPQYMVPAAFVELDVMPLTPNGKIDRKTLPKPEVSAYASREYSPPQDEIEKALAEIWRESLHIERVGRNDDFFELGGHSLSAVQLMARINRQFKQMLPLAVLFTAPTLASLAKLISSRQAPSFDIVVPIQPAGNGLPVFAVPGVGGNVLSLRPLAELLSDEQPLYALQAVGLDGKTPAFGTVEQTAEANIAALKGVQPTGPYSLIGHSYGGVVAYEMARILLEQGNEISSLILLDSLAPSIVEKNRPRDEVVELAEACMALADVYGSRLEIDLEQLRGFAVEEGVQYLAQVLNDRGVEINTDQFAAFCRVYSANQQCYRRYAPRPLSRSINVSLYRASQGSPDRLNLPLDYGWSPLVQSPIRTVDVQADHFSILKHAPLRAEGRAFHAST